MNMNKTNFSATLDIHDIYSQFTMHIKKGDTTGRLSVTLMEGGKPYRIVDGCYAAFSAKKPDKTSLYNTCSIENNKIVHDLTLNTTAVAGKLECELLVFGKDSELLVSPRFTIIVDDTVYNGEQIESSDEFSALTALVSEANTLIEEVNEKLENGEFIGEKGDKGDTGPQGEKGDTYVLTEADKQEIASQVEGYQEGNLENGEGSGSTQQKQDQEANVTAGKFEFTDKNPNTTLTGEIDYGGTGDFATVLGGKAAAMGKRALAHGTTTIAQGNYSHSEGNSTVALGTNSHAEGLQTTAKGNGAHSEGELTIAGGKYSHAEGKKVTSSGDYSHAEGEEVSANGFGSHAEGLRTDANGAYSHAEGQDAKALSDCSHAEGRETEANGRFSHAEGYKAKATAEYAHAEGRETEATAYYAHAEGYGTHAQANNSHTEGEGTTVTEPAKGAHAEGYYATVEAQYAHAEGYIAKVLTGAFYAHAEGYETEAYAEASHAEGRKTKVAATARYAHAEGRETVAEGNFSHAEGYQTVTKGEGSHASGRGTIAGQHYQAVTGQYNNNKTDTVFEIGIGTSDTDRKNGLEVYKDGTIKVYDKTTGDTKELQAGGGGGAKLYRHILQWFLEDIMATVTIVFISSKADKLQLPSRKNPIGYLNVFAKYPEMWGAICTVNREMDYAEDTFLLGGLDFNYSYDDVMEEYDVRYSIYSLASTAVYEYFGSYYSEFSEAVWEV